MAETLRRLLWLVPLLGAASLVLFALLAAGLPAAEERKALPLFFNPAPRGIRDHVAEAVDGLRQGDSPEAADSLARLGGAALPLVLPELEQLDPPARTRIALALAPIARRTGVARDERVLDDPEGSVRFWNRYWQDRSLDYQPTVVSRLVRRVGARSLALGGADLVQLDTYALPELVSQLRSVRTQADVDRVRRLLRVVGEITERRWNVPAGASPAEARPVVTACRRWWDEHRHQYTDVAGLRRVTATVLQTRYGRWALRSLREATGIDSSPVAEELLRRARVTGLLLFCCVVGASLFGILTTTALATFPFRRERLTRLTLAACIALLLPAAVLWPPRNGSALLTACALSLLLGAVPAIHLGRGAVSELSTPSLPTPSRKRLFWTSARAAASAATIWIPLVLAESATLVFALEWSLGLPGLGPRTVAALRVGDVSWLMAICLGLGASTALVQITADAAFIGNLRERSDP